MIIQNLAVYLHRSPLFIQFTKAINKKLYYFAQNRFHFMISVTFSGYLMTRPINLFSFIECSYLERRASPILLQEYSHAKLRNLQNYIITSLKNMNNAFESIYTRVFTKRYNSWIQNSLVVSNSIINIRLFRLLDFCPH